MPDDFRIARLVTKKQGNFNALIRVNASNDKNDARQLTIKFDNKTKKWNADTKGKEGWEKAFAEAARENAALPEEEEEPKKSAGSKAEETAPTELVLPQRQGKTVSPVRYILIGALLAAALCIAIYLFTHPAREEDPEQEQK